MQSVSSRTWTRVAVSISYDDNHYTTCTSIKYAHIFYDQAVYERGYKNGKKSYLRLMDSKMITAMVALLFNDWERDKVFSVQKTKAKENENGILGTLCDSPWAT